MNNRNHTDVSEVLSDNSDFSSSKPLSTNYDELNASQNNQDQEKLIKEKQIQESKHKEGQHKQQDWLYRKFWPISTTRPP